MSSLNNSKFFYSICVLNMMPDEMVDMQVFKTRVKEL